MAPRHHRALKIIAAYKVMKALILLFAATAAFGLIGDDGPLSGLAQRTFTDRPYVEDNDWSFDPIDAGGLDESWRQQPGTPVYTADFDADRVKRALAEANPE